MRFFCLLVSKLIIKKKGDFSLTVYFPGYEKKIGFESVRPLEA